jgi:hypothetical protein
MWTITQPLTKRTISNEITETKIEDNMVYEERDGINGEKRIKRIKN